MVSLNRRMKLKTDDVLNASSMPITLPSYPRGPYRFVDREYMILSYGWNIEMQFKAARQGLRVLELPLPYRCRACGTSKVAGSLRGTLRASWRILAVFTRVAFMGSVNR